MRALWQNTDTRFSLLAVQNLWENLVMLAFVGAYALLEHAPVVMVAMGFGAVVFVGMLALAWRRRSQQS